MAESAARLLLLLELLQTKPSWTGAELSARLGVTDRTLRRDVDRLRGLGYPVQSVRGSAGGYRLGRGARLPPLLLSEGEAVAVAMALRAVAGSAVAGPAPHDAEPGLGEAVSVPELAASALAKLDHLMPERPRQRVDAVRRTALALPRAVASAEPGIFAALALACRREHRVRFAYTDHHGRPSDRHVEPYRLVHSGRYWYLAARDLDRDDWRVFRADRIGRVRETGVRFVVDGGLDAVALVAAAVATGPYPQHAKILLHVAAERAVEYFPPSSAVIEALDGQSCVLSVGAESVDAIVLHLGLAGYEFSVLEPPRLRTRLSELAGLFERAAAAEPTPRHTLPAGP
jgi:predicted DNA-binding transcriptional regulator YafY